MPDDKKITSADIQAVAGDSKFDLNSLDLNDPAALFEWTGQILRHWADFALVVISPDISVIEPPKIHKPEPLEEGGGYEHVYDIQDYGYKFLTAKTAEMFTAGQSMCKLFYTIEKMIALLIERLESSGIHQNEEVQVVFTGYISAQRKAFESIINLPHNIIVTNFEPGDWGEFYIATVKKFADKFGYFPPESPRDVYKKSGPSEPGVKKGR